MPNLVNLRSFIKIPCKFNCKAAACQLASFYEVTACQAAVTINSFFFRSPCGKC